MVFWSRNSQVSNGLTDGHGRPQLKMLDALKKHFVEFPIRKGEMIFDYGDTTTSVFVISSGEVELLQQKKGQSEEQRTVLETLGPGEVFGVSKILFEQKSHNYGARAGTDCKLLIVEQAVLDKKIASADPFLLYCFRKGR